MCACMRFPRSGCLSRFSASVLFFFFKQKTAYEMRISDWSSDVCSSDLTFLCMKYQILAMIERGTKGSIVNTASAAGVVGVPMHGEYVGAKHAVVGLTRVAAADYGKHGIRVNALVPGAVRTPMLQRAMDN